MNAPHAWSTADLINVALLIVAVIGILLTLVQVRTGAKTQRAAFLRDLYGTLNSDDGIREAFYSIEYGNFAYDADFHGSPGERNVDRLLSFIDLVCELHARGELTRQEMKFFEYRVRRIAADENVKQYLSFLTEFYARNKTHTRPFQSFTTYTERLAQPTLVERCGTVLRNAVPAARRKAVFPRSTS